MDRSKLYRRFRTLLIANRGEIACRVIRSARAMGLRTVAVYSEADREAMHVALADEAVLLGPARARDSYLNIERVIAAAKQTGAEAVHPGYGFLSENAEFGEAQDEAILAEAANRIGFPVLVKASAGGGGRGMRVVNSAAELAAAITSAKREAKAAFGDDRMLIEKYVQNPRHIEVQIIGDSHGNLLSLWERECTLQRRHQKVIEEAPSPTLNAAQRETVCEAARKAAGAVNYVGAGTIEFVSDGKDVFFIEMNTRLQVEHPVTELITGVDLVEWQLRVAFGEALPLKQNEIRLNGHAIEARVYAENPQKNFMPSVGRIKTWRTPPDGDGLRIDAGYRSGDNVSPYYDAMLAKVIAWAPTREGAIEKLNRGLEQTDVRGIVTNIPFLSALVTHQATRTNAIDTGFIERELKNLTAGQGAAGDFELCAAVAAIVDDEQKAARREANSPWQAFGWMPVGRRQRVFSFKQGHEPPQTITLHYGNGPSTLSVGGHELAFAISSSGEDGFDLTLNGLKSRVASVIEGHELYLRTRNGRFDLHWVDPFGGESEEQVGEDKIVAPLPGTVVALLAEEGATLEKGAPILTLEVMKMEQTLRAPYAGVLKKLKCKVGDIVGEGVELAEVEPAAAS
ncbi:MAG: 3-methylcrotonyl-CoA carboxylase alpha subunit [Bradyrhizobium sp. DFCI-1]|nr:MAG: 3-methylcrotonyl-CoA carboxylase alpha subunit [Bradyrhizobium sp. DFCI-1]